MSSNRYEERTTTDELFDLTDTVAIVTGGTGLIGERMVRALDAFGATVVAADLDAEAGDRLADELGDGVRFVRSDVTSEDDVTALVEATLDSFGTIDVLVNAAYPRNENYGAAYEAVTADDWRENVTMHLTGVFLPTKLVTDAMTEQNSGGSIVNIGSTYGVQAPDFTLYEGTDKTSPVEYSAIKGGVVNFTRYLASYLGSDGIRVNTISPGGMFIGQEETFVRNYERRTPLGRMSTPDDLDGAVVFLASDASSYVTGHNLVVDGGWTIS